MFDRFLNTPSVIEKKSFRNFIDFVLCWRFIVYMQLEFEL